MSLITTPVQFRIFQQQNGAPHVGVTVEARLTRVEYDGGVLLSIPVATGVTDAAGGCVLNLWPNSRGSSGSQYRVEVFFNGEKTETFLITVPEVAPGSAPIQAISLINQAPYPAVGAAQLAITAAQEQVALATVQAGIAAGNVLLTHADVALTHADVVLTHADAVSTSSDAFATAADVLETALSKSETAAMRDAAQAHALAAQVSATEAFSNAALAAQHKTTATEKAALVQGAYLATAADRVQTGLDAAAATAAAAAAGLDAAATAADRIVTAADRDAAAASALTAAGHEDQTTLDAIATAADRATVAADKSIVAADKATTSGYKDAAAASAATATTQAGLATTNGAAQVSLAAAQVALATTQANNAAASYDAFDDRYLGAKAVAPTLDNDGAALLTGALYWDTALATLRIWTGAAWTNDTTEMDARVLADQQLLGGVAYATDLAASAHRESAAAVARVVAVESGLSAYDLTIEQIIYAVTQALDLAGAAAKAQGAAMQVSAGTLDEPALWPTGDRNTGVYFPAADVVGWITAGLERMRMDANGYLGLGTTTPTGLLDVNADKLRVRTAKTPASATAAGNAGEICWDASYLYVCTSTNVWRRTAHVTW